MFEYRDSQHTRESNLLFDSIRCPHEVFSRCGQRQASLRTNARSTSSNRQTIMLSLAIERCFASPLSQIRSGCKHEGTVHERMEHQSTTNCVDTKTAGHNTDVAQRQMITVSPPCISSKDDEIPTHFRKSRTWVVELHMNIDDTSRFVRSVRTVRICLCALHHTWTESMHVVAGEEEEDTTWVALAFLFLCHVANAGCVGAVPLERRSACGVVLGSASL